MLLPAFGQSSGHDNTSLINEYLQNLQNIEELLIRYKEFYFKITRNKFRINYIEKISIKSDAKININQ